MFAKQSIYTGMIANISVQSKIINTVSVARRSTLAMSTLARSWMLKSVSPKLCPPTFSPSLPRLQSRKDAFPAVTQKLLHLSWSIMAPQEHVGHANGGGRR